MQPLVDRPLDVATSSSSAGSSSEPARRSTAGSAASDLGDGFITGRRGEHRRDPDGARQLGAAAAAARRSGPVRPRLRRPATPRSGSDESAARRSRLRLRLRLRSTATPCRSRSSRSRRRLAEEPPASPILLRGRALAVIGRVEARALVVDRHRVEDELQRRCAAHLARLRRRRGHRLEALERVAFGAAVLVDRHRRRTVATHPAASIRARGARRRDATGPTSRRKISPRTPSDSRNERGKPSSGRPASSMRRSCSAPSSSRSAPSPSMSCASLRTPRIGTSTGDEFAAASRRARPATSRRRPPPRPRAPCRRPVARARRRARPASGALRRLAREQPLAEHAPRRHAQPERGRHRQELALGIAVAALYGIWSAMNGDQPRRSASVFAWATSHAGESEMPT